MAKFNGINHSWFVLCKGGLDVVNNGGSIVLSEGYVDNDGSVTGQKGKYVKYVTSKDDKGKESAKRFRFDLSFRRLMTRETDKDYNGVTQYTWLKNYPQCEGSPNGDYVMGDNGEYQQVGVLFREMNDARDAAVALEADELRIRAQATALELDDQTLSEVGAILGHYGTPDKIMKLRVVEYAGKRPKQFEDILNSGDRSTRAIVRKALSQGLFKQKGTIIYWGDTVVGSDENSAVATLLRDESMLSALKEKLGIPSDTQSSTPPPKKRGNPNFRKQKSDVTI